MLLNRIPFRVILADVRGNPIRCIFSGSASSNFSSDCAKAQDTYSLSLQLKSLLRVTDFPIAFAHLYLRFQDPDDGEDTLAESR